MNRVLVSVEGQTEDALAVQVLQGHLLAFDVWLQPVVVQTKRLASGQKFRGGLSSWAKAHRDIVRLLGASDAKIVTTMYDFYALPEDAPGMVDRHDASPGIARVQHVEDAIRASIDDQRFVPYLSLHEVEALVLAAPAEAIASAAAASAGVDVSALSNLGPPEDVNEEDPPSKRILACWPQYAKTIDGPAIVRRAGLQQIRAFCPHFDQWLSNLESVS